MKRIAIVLLLVATGLWQCDQTKEISHEPGVLVEENPLQRSIDTGEVFGFDDFVMHPVAEFSIKARVLSREKYRMGRESDLSPVDLALGWGVMSDSTVLDAIEISQGNRYYYWRTEQQPPVPVSQIKTHSANMHMIPANPEVADLLSTVRKGHLIYMKGRLVNVTAEDGWRWLTSLVRTDTGAGACELVWVEALEIM